MTVTSFLTHTQRRKLKFSEKALSFVVKMKLSTFVCISYVKLWQELRTRLVFHRCEALTSHQCGLDPNCRLVRHYQVVWCWQVKKVVKSGRRATPWIYCLF